MNKYEFNVNLFGNVTLEVIAENKEEAREMVKDLMDNIEIKNIRLKETNKDSITISESEIKLNIASRNKDLAMER
jgi:polyhydroxyalkanoate synthesis regulator phasin